MAWALRSLRQGALNVGNDAQNKQNLLTLSIAQANLGLGLTGWARWRVGFVSRTSGAGLLLNVPYVPGYTPAPGTGSVPFAAGSLTTDAGVLLQTDSGVQLTID